jgi:hypothetical protein
VRCRSLEACGEGKGAHGTGGNRQGYLPGQEGGAYITNSLVNKQDASGHVYNDVLTDAALMGFNGAEWAKTSGLSVSKAEIDKLNELFKQKGANNIPSVNLGGKKYQVTHYDGNAAYLKIKDGGATVAKTNQAYIIGVYNSDCPFNNIADIYF